LQKSCIFYASLYKKHTQPVKLYT